MSYSSRILELERENEDVKQALSSSQKLTEMQAKENKRLLDKKQAGGKENRVLKKEISVNLLSKLYNLF